MDNNFEFYTGLRGYNVYSNTVRWKPYVGQKITLKRDHNNPTTNLQPRLLLLRTYQESSLDISGFQLEKGLNLKLKFTKGNQCLLH